MALVLIHSSGLEKSMKEPFSLVRQRRQNLKRSITKPAHSLSTTIICTTRHPQSEVQSKDTMICDSI